MSTAFSLDQLLDELRRSGRCELGFDREEVSRFKKCCSRLDGVASVADTWGILGRLLCALIVPVVMLLNKATVRNHQRVATAVDFYAVARGELKSVTGQPRDDGSVVVTFSS